MPHGGRGPEHQRSLHDPDPGPDTNRALAHEFREAVGDDRQPDRPDLERIATGAGGRLGPALAANGPLIGITFATVLVVGVIVALASRSWWAVVVAAGVHALGTVLVGIFAFRMANEVEHAEPSTAARLEEQGIDVDRALNELTQHPGPPPRSRDAPDTRRRVLLTTLLLVSGVVVGVTLMGLVAGYVDLP